MDNEDEIDYCKTCKWQRISHTVMLGGTIVPERYCGFTNTDEYCYGGKYEEDE
jgi:hypothetical protein